MPNIVKANEDILANNNKEEIKALKDTESEEFNNKHLETMQTGVGDSFTEEPPAKKPFSTNQTQESIKENSFKRQ